jgi:hypothetical protein
MPETLKQYMKRVDACKKRGGKMLFSTAESRGFCAKKALVRVSLSSDDWKPYWVHPKNSNTLIPMMSELDNGFETSGEAVRLAKKEGARQVEIEGDADETFPRSSEDYYEA